MTLVHHVEQLLEPRAVHVLPRAAGVGDDGDGAQVVQLGVDPELVSLPVDREPLRRLLSGKVRCGLCQRLMAIDFNGDGRRMYRCQHRGQGCRQPRRTVRGLLRAAVLGMRLIAEDEHLRAAIRRELERHREPAAAAAHRASGHGKEELEAQRRKLLRLFYEDRVGADLFAEEEARLVRLLELARAEQAEVVEQVVRADDVRRRFDEVAETLAQLDVDRVWQAATDAERRVLVDELLESVTVLPDHLEVTIAGAPRLNVLLAEVGLKAPSQSQTVGVGGGT